MSEQRHQVTVTVNGVTRRAEVPARRLLADFLRMDLRRVETLMRELTPDQRLVLISQVALGMPRAEFCRRYGWSPEKYRKVAQRARARLGRLMASDEADVPDPHGRSDEGTGTHP